jgi:hypothetical protein
LRLQQNILERYFSQRKKRIVCCGELRDSHEKHIEVNDVFRATKAPESGDQDSRIYRLLYCTTTTSFIIIIIIKRYSTVQ